MSTLRLLSLALVVQVGLAVLMWWPQDRSALRPHPLLDIPADTIDELRIARKPAAGEELDWLHLVREAGAWKIESAAGYPAQQDKVDDLIGKLLGMRVRRPIATRTTSHNALKVGEKQYGRRVEIRAGETRRELIIGAAKSNSVNVRLADEPDVYLASGLSEWSLQDDARSYWDSSYVDANPAEMTTLQIDNEFGTLRFSRADDGWSLDGLPEGALADGDEIERFLRKVATVRLQDPVGSESKPEYGLDSGARVSWTIAAENESVSGGYTVGAARESLRYVKSDNDPFVVEVSESSLKELREATLQKFIAD